MLFKKEKGTNMRPARPVCVKEDLYSNLRQVWASGILVEVFRRYSCIPQDITERFVRQCALCLTHKNNSRQTVSKPIVLTNFLTEVQVDIVYMGSIPDGNTNGFVTLAIILPNFPGQVH